MLRFTISEAGQPPLPAVDLDEPSVVIGSGPAARIRLPAAVARERHVELAAGRWRASEDVVVDGAAREVGAEGAIGAGVLLELGAYRVRVEPAPAGAAPSPPQRTESLARELVRGLLGAGAAPTISIERGPAGGAVRTLPPPESVLVIGRGDEAGWVIVDEDLSRAHVEVRRGWDGVAIRDLGSKNGTRVEGAAIGGEVVALRDGAEIALGKVVLRFRDPAEQHLRGEGAAKAAASASSGQLAVRATARASGQQAVQAAPAAGAPWVTVGALVLAGIALGALVWVIAS